MRGESIHEQGDVNDGAGKNDVLIANNLGLTMIMNIISHNLLLQLQARAQISINMHPPLMLWAGLLMDEIGTN